MANIKISQLADRPVTASDEFAVNEAGTTKKVSATQIFNYLKDISVDNHWTTVLMPVEQSSISTTGIVVTDLIITLTTGHYVFEYFLLCDGFSGIVGMELGLNFTGSQTRLSAITTIVGTSSSVVNGAISVTASGNMVEGILITTEETTAISRLAHTGLTTGGPNYLTIKGILEATSGGDLELWINSQGTGSSNRVDVSKDSCLRIMRTN